MSLITLGLYCVQQLGVTFAVGAETVMLVAYLQSVRDGVVDEEEKGFARAVRSVKDFGLFFIILSGGAIFANQFFTGQLTEFLSITVLFKWSLIGIVLFMSLIVRGPSLVAGLLQGLSAATWYALFAVHILAPEAPWEQLVTFYAVWLVGFSLCWTIIVFALKGKKPAYVASPINAVSKAAVVITPDRVKPVFKPAPQPVVAPAPVVAFVPPVTVTMPKQEIPVAPKPSIPTPPVPQPAPVAATMPPPPPVPPPPPPKVSVPAPAAPPPPASWLHVMPRTPQELAERKTQTP